MYIAIIALTMLFYLFARSRLNAPFILMRFSWRWWAVGLYSGL